MCVKQFIRIFNKYYNVMLCLFCFDCTVHSIDCSPGPKYHIDAKLTRFGRDGTPAYSIHGRMESRGKSVISKCRSVEAVPYLLVDRTTSCRNYQETLSWNELTEFDSS